jgi:hypothetical protein
MVDVAGGEGVTVVPKSEGVVHRTMLTWDQVKDHVQIIEALLDICNICNKESVEH